MSTCNDDYDNTSNDPIAPKKRHHGVSYNSRSYYTTNYANSVFNQDWENSFIGCPDSIKSCPKVENKNSTHVILTGKRIKHRYSHNHCSIFHCGCEYRDKKKKVPKEEAKKLKSIIDDAFVAFLAQNGITKIIL